MSKRYYWLKISEHFFDDDNIKWLESQENGIDYVYFWIKLLLKCLKNKDSGEYGMLRFTERIPYDDNTLSKFTNTSIDTVRIAMKLFQELGMLEILEDQTIYIEAVNKMIGSESDAAERMRKMRVKVEKNLLHDDRNNVTPMLRQGVLRNKEKRREEIDIEKEVEEEKEEEKKKTLKPEQAPFLKIKPDNGKSVDDNRSKTRDQQLIELAQRMKNENPGAYKALIEQHPEIREAVNAPERSPPWGD